MCDLFICLLAVGRWRVNVPTDVETNVHLLTQRRNVSVFTVKILPQAMQC